MGGTAESRRRALVAAAIVFAALPATAAGQSADRFVTLVARECDSYTDVRANLARNDIQESLEDLGADTLYEAGEPIDPRTELAGQPKCRPLVGWRFTFGRGIQSRAVSGPWGALSIVTEPDKTSAVTKPDVPARDFDAHPVSGGVNIEGAVTIGLDRDQVDASATNRLWLQGGTPTDPVLYADPQFAARYGFAALRCAIDDLNGDNVETIAFPSGTRHMYCYAYYVTPPPSSGRIVIRKEVAGSAAAETFRFGGNLSYNDGGAFDLSASASAPASAEFVRAETGPGDAPWTVTEEPVEGWTLTGLTCTSQSSATTTDLAARTARITLVAGDTVTCTFTNRLTPPAGALVLRKVTEDGTGSFAFTVRDAAGDDVAQRTLTTRAPGGVGALSVLQLDPGVYRISEQRPVSRDGVWRQRAVRCNGTEIRPGAPVTVRVTAGTGAACTFVNRLDRPGAIRVNAVSIGGLGTAAYLVSPAGEPSIQRRQLARTQRQGRAVRARGQATDELPFGRYVIQQSAVAVERLDEWSLIAVSCNGKLHPFAQGRVIVRITRATPVQDCTFVNLRRRAPDPPGPGPGPQPDPPPDPSPAPAPVPGGPAPDLQVGKRLVSAPDAQSLTFAIRVTNRSSVTTTRVAVADRLATSTSLISASPARGRCVSRGRLVMCALGDLAPGASTTVRVRVQRQAAAGGINVAVVGAGSPEIALSDNATETRFAAAGAPDACAASTGPVAHAAC